MKNFIFTLLIVLSILFAISFSVNAQNINIAYVDLQRIMLESDKGKEAKSTLTGEAERLRKLLDGKQEELQKMKDMIERQSATITPDARAGKEKEYQNKLKDYQRLANDYQTELQQKDGEFTQKILKDVEEVIKSIGDRDKYTLILEKSQAGILFASPLIDITNKVISQYNDFAKRKAAPKK